jgi:hypothetical protein
VCKLCSCAVLWPQRKCTRRQSDAAAMSNPTRPSPSRSIAIAVLCCALLCYAMLCYAMLNDADRNLMDMDPTSLSLQLHCQEQRLTELLQRAPFVPQIRIDSVSQPLPSSYHAFRAVDRAGASISRPFQSSSPLSSSSRKSASLNCSSAGL